MSKIKQSRASARSVGAEPPLEATESHGTFSLPVLDEGSFKTLQDKIQAKLQTAGKRTTGKKQIGEKTKPRADLITPVQGKKRTSDGAIKETKGQVLPLPSQKIVANTPIDDDEANEMQKALKELGGTQEDLDLIGNASSDSEMEGINDEPTKHVVAKDAKDLEKGMANILKEIALAQGAREQYSETKSDSDGVEEEDMDMVPAPASTNKKTGKSRFTCEPRADWFNLPSPNVNLEKGGEFTPTQYMFEQLHTHAKSMLEADNDAFKATQQSSSSQAFYNTVIASGTLSDKISALTLAVQESPVHNVDALKTLVGLATKRNRAQALDVLRALKDLLAQGSLLPGERRLYSFSTQPAVVAALGQVRSWRQGDKLPRGISDCDLVCWAYESWLKEQYFEVLKSLEIWCNDEIDFSRQRAVSYIYELLKEKPEQESNLLRLLVNKLGDPVKKIASQTSFLLMQLLVNHPAMKMVVISAVESDFLFRPGQSMHGKYYAITTLNQTALSQREEDVAKKLLDIYFGMFTGLLKTVENKTSDNTQEDGSENVVSLNRRQQQRKKSRKNEPTNAQGEELREKLVSAILTGVNRAYPYAGADQNNFNKHLDTLFAITHSANFNTSIQAMLLIQQLTVTNQAASDRFYRTLYESLLDQRLVTASKQQLYLNLLHRSLKSDLSTKRVQAFVKRLLQILSLHDPAFVCGVFFLLTDLEKTFPSMRALFDKHIDIEDAGEEVFQDAEEDVAARTMQATTVQPLNQYDGHKRAPEHANADNSNAWEVLPFLAHFHPSVSVSAANYLQQVKLPGKPDLSLHTLIHFLDRFVYRNPKLSSNKMRGASIMQSMASEDTHAVLISSGTGQVGPAVNTEEFKNRKGDDIAIDDAFFHKYFTALGKETKSKKTRKGRDVGDDESIGDEGEDEVWKAMMDSAPDLEGAESDEEELDMSDFEAEMDEEDGIDMLDDEDDSGVDIEAGIFDDDDDDELSLADMDDGVIAEQAESDFEGVSSEDEATTAKKERNKKKKEERKKRKGLPTFASAADYAKMLDDDEDEDLG